MFRLKHSVLLVLCCWSVAIADEPRLRDRIDEGQIARLVGCIPEGGDAHGAIANGRQRGVLVGGDAHVTEVQPAEESLPRNAIPGLRDGQHVGGMHREGIERGIPPARG